MNKKETKKIRLIKNTWYNLLINYIPEPITKSVGGFKENVIRLVKTNSPKQTVYGRGTKLSKPKTQNNIKIPFLLKRKEKKVQNRIIRDILALFETEEEKKRKKLEKKRTQ